MKVACENEHVRQLTNLLVLPKDANRAVGRKVSPGESGRDRGRAKLPGVPQGHAR